MNFYYRFYCKSYTWYNPNGRKDKDSLRLSAIALMAGLFSFNILTIIFFISLNIKHTIVNKWQGLLLFSILYAINLLIISTEKSDALNAEYKLLPETNQKRINIEFYSYLIVSLMSFIFILGLTAYIKYKYGNYDL